MKSNKVVKDSGEVIYCCPGCGREFQSPRSAGAHVYQCVAAGGGVSEETRRKLSESKKGKPCHSEESKRKLSEIHRRENLSEETLLKMSKSSSAKWTSELRAQQSKMMSELLKGNQRRKGIPHTQETKNHLSEVLSGRTLSEEDRHHKSEATRRTIEEGTWNGFKNDDVGFYKSIRCKYKDCYLRSRYEAIFLCWLVVNDIEFEYESLRLPYDDESGRLYIPDFYLPDSNEIVEIKGRTDLDEVMSRSKRLVDRCGYNFVAVVGDDIWEAYRQLEELGVNIKELYRTSAEVFRQYKKGEVNDVLKFDIVGNKIIFINGGS